jgi:hypothetical protein
MGADDSHPAAVAWWICNPSRKRVQLCQSCLDIWFDNADDGNEPAAWGWLYGCRPPATGGTVTTSRLQRVGEEGCTLMVPPPERRPNLGISINITDMAAALADPANHQALMTALRRESRIQGKPLHQLTGWS